MVYGDHGGNLITSDTILIAPKNQTLYARWSKKIVKKAGIRKVVNQKKLKLKIQIKQVKGADGYQII